MFAQMDSYINCNKIYKVGAYVRLSREDEKDDKTIQSESIQNQKDYVTRFIIENGWSIYKIYSDDGWSGTNFERPGFKNLIKDIENGSVNLVITKDLSRLGRDYIDTGYYMEKYFPEHGVRFIAINDGIDTFANDSGNDMGPFRSVINDMYAKDISKKVRTVMDTKRKNGEFVGAFAPYGYKKSPEDKNKLIIDDDAAVVVKRIFQMYVSGIGLGVIARKLNDEGIPSPSLYKFQYCNYKNPKLHLGLWNPITVRYILINPTYKGDLTQNKYVKINYKVKKLRNLPRNAWVTVQNTHEPIVSGDTFELVQKLIDGKVGGRHSYCKTEHLLTGLIFCGDCGERMTFSKSPGRYAYCICSKYKRYGNCTRHSILEDKLNNYVINELKKISSVAVNQEKLMDMVQNKVDRSITNDTNMKISCITMRINEINRALKSLYDDKLKGIISENDFIDMSREYSKEKGKLNIKLTEMNEKLEKLNESQSEADKLGMLIKEFCNLKNIDRTVIVNLVDSIEVFESKKIAIHFKFKKPF